MTSLASRTLTTLALMAAATGAISAPTLTPTPARAQPAARVLLAQTAPPAPAASAPAPEAQPDNREAPPQRPGTRRRGVGVVISMNLA